MVKPSLFMYLALSLAASYSVADVGAYDDQQQLHSMEYKPQHEEPELPLTNRLPFKLQRRYRHKNNIPSGYIFNKHLRKCGGTTLRTYLEDVTLYYHNLVTDRSKSFRSTGRSSTCGNVTYYEQEFYSMDWQCPKHDAQRWRDTLSVISLRHPIERHLSEFFYSGPGRTDVRLKELHNERLYDNGEFKHLMRIELTKWVEEGMVVNRRHGCLRRHFSDEFQVRALSGELTSDDQGPLPYFQPKPECSVHLLVNGTFENNMQCGFCGTLFCDGPCSYGSHWRGGIRTGQAITEESLQRAKAVLHNFDIVLITETMGEDDVINMMADVTGVPLVNASLRMDGKKLRASGQVATTAEEKHNYYQSILKESKSDDMLELLAKHSKYEILLYEEATRIHHDIVQQWKEEKKSQFESQSR